MRFVENEYQLICRYTINRFVCSRVGVEHSSTCLQYRKTHDLTRAYTVCDAQRVCACMSGGDACCAAHYVCVRTRGPARVVLPDSCASLRAGRCGVCCMRWPTRVVMYVVCVLYTLANMRI